LRSVIIPARGGSQRIKGKNIRSFAGSPMISWPINACIETGLFDDIFVSTDSQEIASVAEAVGAKVLWRPDYLADSYAGTTPVIQEILTNQLAELPDDYWIYMIYPTSPITGALVSNFVNFSEKNAGSFSVSVGKFRNHIQRALGITENQTLQFLNSQYVDSRSQDLEEHFFDAGKLYGANASTWREASSPLLGSPKGFHLPMWATVDIDTEDDWLLAELCFTHLRNV